MNKESSKNASKYLTKADGVSDNEHYTKAIILNNQHFTLMAQ